MKNRVIALVTCALGMSILGHFGCTAVDRTYADDTAAGSAGVSGGGSSGTSGAAGDAGMSAGGATSGSGGVSGAGTSGDAGNGGEAGAATPSCVKDNDACQVAGLVGLCFNGECSTCSDVVDDKNCATAYGPGHLCLNGTCAPGDCRLTTDCNNKVCKDNQCTGCQADGDCGDPALICNTATGACVSNACTAADVGKKCSANASDVCCTVSAVTACRPGQCCVNSDCTTANTVCVSGTCVPQGCTAPSDHKYYVNPSAASEGTGSQACPFKTITQAFKKVGAPADTKADAVLIAVMGDVGPAETFPLYWPQGLGSVTLQTGGSQTITVPANTTAFRVVNSANSEDFHVLGFIVQQAAAGTATAGAAFDVQSTSSPSKPQLTLDQVTVRNFHSGLYVHDGGFVGINPGVSVVQNTGSGMLISDAKATVSAPTASSLPIHFDGNVNGIYVDGTTSALTIKGACISGCPTTGNPNAPVMTVTTSNNTGLGFRIYTLGASSIDSLNSDNNGTEGGFIYATTPVKVRSSTFRKNGAGGLRVAQAAADPADFSGVDLGTLASYGHNLISQNGGSGICLSARSAATLHAQGNAFRGGDGVDHDCSVNSPAYKPSLTTTTDCSSANLGFLNVAGTILVDNCTNQ